MKEDVTASLATLERAMKLEREGRQFYLKAAKATPDEKGQEMFTTLAADEKNHYDLLIRQHTALKREGVWVSSPGTKVSEIDIKKPLFPKGKKALEKAVNARSNDRDALLFGLDIENKTYDLYREAALETQESAGKQMFEFLAGQERGHFNTLMMRYDALFGPVAWTS